MRILFLLISFFLVGVCSAEELPFEKTVRIEKRKGCYYLVLDVHNRSSVTMYFAPGAPPMGMLNQNGQLMDETGIIADFGKLAPEDYEMILPGKRRRQIVLISDHFKFSGNGSYQILLPGGYYDPLNNLEYSRPQIAVGFTYTGEKGMCRK